MKVTSIATNGVKLLSGLANNEDSLAAMVVKDWIGDGATVYTYKKDGGKDDAREKAIEEFGTGAIWLFAIPAIKKLIELTLYPIFKLNPDFDPRLLDKPDVLQNMAKHAIGDEKTLFESLNKPNEVIKGLKNSQMYKTFAVGKFAIATLIAAFGLTKIIKFKQKTTSDRIQNDKKIQQQNFTSSTTSALVQNSVNKNKNFESFTSNNKKKNNVSFTGGLNLAEFMYNPIKNTMILDGVIATTRLKEARKEERLEVAFKEICQVVFIYGLAKPIQWMFEKAGELAKCPIKLDPKNLFDKNLIEKIESSKESIDILAKSENMIEALSGFAKNKSPLIELLNNEGLISLTKNGDVSMLKPINENAIKGALNNFNEINNKECIKNLSKIKAFKTFAVVVNVLIAAGIMGVVQPKMTIWLREKLFGSKENPAIAKQEQEVLNA